LRAGYAIDVQVRILTTFGAIYESNHIFLFHTLPFGDTGCNVSFYTRLSNGYSLWLLRP
jgi:hypothetical protein